MQYSREHIPGAINVPYVEIRAVGSCHHGIGGSSSIAPRNMPISQYAYEALDQLGYEEIYDMRAGLQGWKDAGLPTIIGADSTAVPD